MARVDTSNEVPESDEGNNELETMVEVLEAPSQPETVTVLSEASLDGYRVSDGTGSAAQDIIVGNGEISEDGDELVARGFLSFDISGIPSEATIEKLELRFYQKEIEGDPYSKLGALALEHVSYGDSLGAEAFDTPATASALLGSETSPGAWYILSDASLVSWLASDLATGLPRFQLRLRFEQEVDGDGIEDWIGVTPGGGVMGSRNAPQLTITYLP